MSFVRIYQRNLGHEMTRINEFFTELPNMDGKSYFFLVVVCCCIIGCDAPSRIRFINQSSARMYILPFPQNPVLMDGSGPDLKVQMLDPRQESDREVLSDCFFLIDEPRFNSETDEKVFFLDVNLLWNANKRTLDRRNRHYYLNSDFKVMVEDDCLKIDECDQIRIPAIGLKSATYRKDTLSQMAIPNQDYPIARVVNDSDREVCVLCRNAGSSSLMTLNVSPNTRSTLIKPLISSQYTKGGIDEIVCKFVLLDKSKKTARVISCFCKSSDDLMSVVVRENALENNGP